jgi:AcrR family transcriptional regulator
MGGNAVAAADGGSPRRAAVLEQTVLAHAHEHPGDGQAKVARALRGRGLRISPAGVRYIWRKHGLETTYKRLRAIDSDGPRARELTPGQIAILRRGETTRRLVKRSRLATRASESAVTDARRSQIMLAAAELFVRHGYAGTSIRDIARSVGLLPGSVYHYFPGKEDLFVAVNHEAFRRLELRIQAALDERGTPRQRLDAACAAHVEAVLVGDPIARFGATALFAIHEENLQRRMQPDRETYDTLFRELVDDLDLPRGTNRSVFRLSLVGALNWTRLWYRQGKLAPREIARQIVATFCGGSGR